MARGARREVGLAAPLDLSGSDPVFWFLRLGPDAAFANCDDRQGRQGYEGSTELHEYTSSHAAAMAHSDA
jgi:hypothetical protein